MGFMSSFIVTNITSNNFSARESQAFLSTIATVMTIEVGYVSLIGITKANRKLTEIPSVILVPRTTTRVPSYVFPELNGNFSAIEAFLSSKLDHSVFSGLATKIFRQNLHALGVKEALEPSIIAVFSGSEVVEPTFAPTSFIQTSATGSSDSSSVSTALLIGAIVGSAFFICVFFPIAYFLSRKSWDKKQEGEDEVVAKTESKPEESTSLTNDREFDFIMFNDMKKSVDRDQLKRSQNYDVKSMNPQIALRDYHAEEFMGSNNDQRFDSYHSIYLQPKTVDSTKEKENIQADKEQENLGVVVYDNSSPRFEVEAEEPVICSEVVQNTMPSSTKKENVTVSRKVGNFFSFSAAEKPEYNGEEEFAAIEGSKAAIEATTMHPSRLPNLPPPSPPINSQKKDKNNFFSFGAIDRMENPGSFDIAEFYPGSESFDVEFAAAMSTVTFLSGEKEGRGMKFVNLPPQQASGLLSEASKPSLRPHSPTHGPRTHSPTLETVDEKVNERERNTMASPYSPHSDQISFHRRIHSSGDPDFVRVSREVGEDPATNSLEDATLHMSSSPHSVRFRAIKTKFENMIQKNTKALTLNPVSLPSSPSSANSKGVVVGGPIGHRRSRSDGPVN